METSAFVPGSVSQTAARQNKRKGFKSLESFCLPIYRSKTEEHFWSPIAWSSSSISPCKRKKQPKGSRPVVTLHHSRENKKVFTDWNSSRKAGHPSRFVKIMANKKWDEAGTICTICRNDWPPTFLSIALPKKKLANVW